MKKLILIGSLVLIFSCKKENSASKESKTKPFVENTELKSLEDIKKEYNAYNLLIDSKKLDSISFNYECNNEVEGTVVYYLEKNQLKMIKNSYSENSHFSSVENYYVKNDTPFFIFKQETVWQFDGGTPEKPETKDEITEKRFYIINRNLIQSLEKNYSVHSSLKSDENPEKIPNREIKNSSFKELQKEFKILFENKDKMYKTMCL